MDIRVRKKEVVGEIGFEPTTHWSQTSCATKLRYSPIDGVANGIRTHDNWNHNPGLYQLSYSHHYKSCYAVLLPPQLKRRD